MRHLHRSLKSLLAIKSGEDFHDFLIRDAIDGVVSDFKSTHGRAPTILAVCADWKEAATLSRYPFESITLAGWLAADERLQEYIRKDPRIHYEQQNTERLSYASRSFDIVFCKEGLHHLARPVLGLYEMLRTCRHAAIFIEGYDGWLNRRLEKLGLSSIYEGDQLGNIGQRRNYVFRWSRRQLETLLNSYYLDSGWRLSLVTGWMGWRVQLGRRPWLRVLGVTAGWLASLFPGFEGNYLTVTITPGGDLPGDPQPIEAPGT